MNTLTEPQMRLYVRIVDLAGSGAVLPNAGKLAQMIGVGEGSIDTVLCALQRKGYIRIAKRPHGRRVVEVVATGQSTGEPPVITSTATRRGPQRCRNEDSPIRAMVRRTFAEFERELPYRRAARASASLALGNYESAHGENIDRPTGSGCLACGSARGCSCLTRVEMYR